MDAPGLSGQGQTLKSPMTVTPKVQGILSGWAWKHVPRAWRSPATCESGGAADCPHGQPGPREVAGDPPPAPLNAEGKWVMAGVLLSSSLFANLPLPILLGKVLSF